MTEAGGRFTDLSGVDRADGGSVVCSNGLLHDAVLGVLGPDGGPDRPSAPASAASIRGASASAAASKNPYPPAAPDGGLPIEIRCAIGSFTCQVQAPRWVPSSSR